MASNVPVIMRVLARSVSAVNQASKLVREIMTSGELGVIDKSLGKVAVATEDYQTEADRRAQRLIISSLTATFPKLKIVGEEDLDSDEQLDRQLSVTDSDCHVLQQQCPKQYESLAESDLTVWVDPLDGTQEYVRGKLDHVTVLVGISIDGKSVAGVVGQPFYGFTSDDKDYTRLTGRIMWGLVGLGPFGVKMDHDRLPKDKLIVVTTASHPTDAVLNAIEAVKPDQIVRVGGAGFKVLEIIEGHAHTYMFASPFSSKWDTCAPEALLRSAGGILTDTFGRQIYYRAGTSSYKNSTGVMASISSPIHERIISLMPQSVKDAMTSASSSL